MKKVLQSRFLSVSLSAVVSVLSVAAIGYAATTISTGINTGGTLTVSGASTLTGAISSAGDISFTGASATTTITGGLRADSADNTFVVDFSSSKIGVGTTSPTVLLSVHGSALIGSADSDTFNVRSGVWNLTSTATTTVGLSKGVNFGSGTLVIVTDGNTIGTVGVGTTTPTRGNFSVEGSGTTTLIVNTTANQGVGSQGSCIELKAIGGTVMHIYATSSDRGFPLLEKGSCTLRTTGI